MKSGAVDAAPSWAACAEQLDDLICLTEGSYGPGRRCGLPGGDGTDPVIEVPAGVAASAAAAGHLRVVDPEGAPVTTLRVLGHTPSPTLADHEALDAVVVGHTSAAVDRGPSTSTTGGRVLAVPVDAPATWPLVASLAAAAEEVAAQLRVLVLTGTGRGETLHGRALARSWSSATTEVSEGRAPVQVERLDVVAVRAPSRPDPAADAALALRVARAHGATHVPADLARLAGDGTGQSPEAVLVPAVARDLVTGRWTADPAGRPVADVVADILRDPAGPTSNDAPPGTRRELRRARRAGVTLFFTGLSGSGKSTLARAVADLLLDRSDRNVSVLDGDVVRRLLSSELSFSREHRDLNVRRIGYVAAEVTAHGGIAICAPIAPYAATRAAVRRMVEQHGQFVLVHVSTPLGVCEQRDRKGLYALARAGRIPEFTGVSDTYEEPDDADLVLDTSHIDLDVAAHAVLDLLNRRSPLITSED